MDTLRIRMYNVRFGDAILVSVPDRTASGRPKMRHILIDMGNVSGGEGGADSVFEPVIEDIRQVLDGDPLDLYVMTHEHLDHVQGLLYASEKLGLALKVRHAWLTASAEPGYYQQFPDAKRQLDERLALYDAIAGFLRAAPASSSRLVQAMMLNNNPRRTADCVEYLRKLANRTTYVYRGCTLSRRHTFHAAKLQVLAPELDTSTYYGQFQPMALSAGAGPGGEDWAWLTQPSPPAGVDAGAFYDLVGIRQHGWVDNLLAIDRAANNTSVVMMLDWRGWRLLFTGDAEHRSWKEMGKRGVLVPVHFLKVSHHCSHTGMPEPTLLDKLLPLSPTDGRPRHAAMSTFPDTYNGVPDETARSELERRSMVHSTEGLVDGEFIDIEFPG